MTDWNKYHNFREHEFRCKCKACQAANLPVDVDERLVAGLQELRDLLGRPIRVSSGVRCRDHNASIGGAINSQHLVGRAADIVVKGLDPVDVMRAATQIPQFRDGGIGLYPRRNNRAGWVHVDVRAGKARWQG